MLNDNDYSFYCGICVFPNRFLFATAYWTSFLKFITGVTRDNANVRVAIVAMVFDSYVCQN